MNFGFLKRGRKAEALKFDFELRAMEIAHESIAGKLVCVRWSRGSKKTGVSKNVVSSSDGRAIWAHDEPLKLTVTLYRSKPTSIFDSKEIKLSLEEVVKVGKTKILGRGSLNLARYADSGLTVASNRVELRLKGKEAEGAEMRCIVKSQHLDGKSASLDRGDSHSSASFSGSEAPGQSCDDSPRSSLEIDDDAGDALAACSSQPAGESSARRAARDRDDGASRQSQDYNPRRTDARVADRAVARRSMDSSARPAAADEQNPSWRIKALRSLGSSSHLVDRDSARAGSLRPVAGAAAEVPWRAFE